MAGRSENGGRAAGVLQLGLVFVTNVLLFTWLGRVVDRRLGTNGLFTAVFTLAGLCASFVISGIALSRLQRRPRR